MTKISVMTEPKKKNTSEETHKLINIFIKSLRCSPSTKVLGLAQFIPNSLNFIIQ